MQIHPGTARCVLSSLPVKEVKEKMCWFNRQWCIPQLIYRRTGKGRYKIHRTNLLWWRRVNFCIVRAELTGRKRVFALAIDCVQWMRVMSGYLFGMCIKGKEIAHALLWEMFGFPSLFFWVCLWRTGKPPWAPAFIIERGEQILYKVSWICQKSWQKRWEKSLSMEYPLFFLPWHGHYCFWFLRAYQLSHL